MSKNKANKTLKLAIAVVVILIAVATADHFNIQALLRETLEWVDQQGMFGIAVYCGLYILACVFLIPGSILTLGAGVIFGAVKGTIIVSLASTTGATAAFLIGRYFARSWVSGKVEGNPRFKAIDEAVAGEGWKIVGLTRLSPVFPFNLLNYAFGLTKVSARDYIAASWIGMIPGTVMYVYVGSLAGDLASLGNAASDSKSPMQWAMTIVGFIATVVVTVIITRIAKKALSSKLQDKE